jgi:hypothetical protein
MQRRVTRGHDADELDARIQDGEKESDAIVCHENLLTRRHPVHCLHNNMHLLERIFIINQHFLKNFLSIFDAFTRSE